MTETLLCSKEDSDAHFITAGTNLTFYRVVVYAKTSYQKKSSNTSTKQEKKYQYYDNI